MLDDQDPAPASMADLSYAIASARAVIMALIVQDRDAAEDAALRTCRDCDLLIRLIRDLAAVLQTNDRNQLTCSQADLRWLARRAEYVLRVVGSPAPQDRPSCFPSAQDDTGRTDLCTKQEASPPSSLPRRPASQDLTVASTGLRVRLIPIDGEAADSSRGNRNGDRPGPEGDAPRKPVER